ncbi:ice-binding family protein [Dyadobacter sp. CY343]|uniref:ice-binding family protein n=1 Tax=Dyadobacter sp. CY343 TaxID=2907299 RepID=UPI001F325E48|nr:ice-binding family protein [Dyadobacter sp. CY343]MCE7059739.1 ice-binding family protein [Dyadobacter sp. CY343]
MKTSFLNVLAATTFVALAPHLSSAQTAPTFGTALRFALYTSAGEFANTGTTTVTGDIGNFTGDVTGTPVTVTGQTHFGDIEGALAVADVAAAYAFLASEVSNPCESSLGSTIGEGATLLEGVHCSTTATAFTGDLTLDAEGNPDAIFIIKINGALSADASANIILTGGAQTTNVYWQVNGAFNVASGVNFKGSVVNAGAINLASGASLSGRALSTAGKISLDNNIISNSEISLPVTLTRFDVAKGEMGTVVLDWATTSETNSDRFEIQRSENGKLWNKLAHVMSNGESAGLISYSYTDATPVKGKSLYRLKIIDKDETFAYSKIRSISLDAANKIALYPNPAVDQLTLLANDPGKIQRVQFLNTAGKLVMDQGRSEFSNADSTFSINHFPVGLYIVKITFDNGTVERTKVVKK